MSILIAGGLVGGLGGVSGRHHWSGVVELLRRSFCGVARQARRGISVLVAKASYE